MSNPSEKKVSDSGHQESTASCREAWDSPRLIPLDLGSAQAKYCSFTNEGNPDNGPKATGCGS
jgi:hypothetical protein